MHFIHVTHRPSSLSLVYLKCSQNTYISLHLGKVIWHKAYFILKCSISHVIYWIPYLKQKTERVSEYRMVVSVSVMDPPDGVADGELWLLPLPSITRRCRTASRQPRKRSKFTFWSIIAPECILSYHHKVKTSKVGTICNLLGHFFDSPTLSFVGFRLFISLK